MLHYCEVRMSKSRMHLPCCHGPLMQRGCRPSCLGSRGAAPAGTGTPLPCGPPSSSKIQKWKTKKTNHVASGSQHQGHVHQRSRQSTNKVPKKLPRVLF